MKKNDMPFGVNDIAFRLKYLAVISLYNSNPNGVDLFDENGDFIYREDLKMDN